MEKLLDELHRIKGYSYQIWHYNLSHSILTLRAKKKEKEHHNIHITFADVGYFQFPFSWRGDLDLAPETELVEILERAGFGRLDQAISMEYVQDRYSLYKAESGRSIIFILGRLASIEYDVEPIYN